MPRAACKCRWPSAVVERACIAWEPAAGENRLERNDQKTLVSPGPRTEGDHRLRKTCLITLSCDHGLRKVDRGTPSGDHGLRKNVRKKKNHRLRTTGVLCTGQAARSRARQTRCQVETRPEKQARSARQYARSKADHQGRPDRKQDGQDDVGQAPPGFCTAATSSIAIAFPPLHCPSHQAHQLASAATTPPWASDLPPPYTNTPASTAFRPFVSITAASHCSVPASTATHSSVSVPAIARLPTHESANRVGSSLVNISTSSGRLGLKPCNKLVKGKWASFSKWMHGLEALQGFRQGGDRDRFSNKHDLSSAVLVRPPARPRHGHRGLANVKLRQV
eukprot:364814-Chlamydomonas_euryale.AAC.2